MAETTARTPSGQTLVARALCDLVAEMDHLTVSELAALIALSGVIGEPGTTDASPVGLWVIRDLQERHHIDAAAYHWQGSVLTVYDAEETTLGQIDVPPASTLYRLEREVNSGARPEITRHAHINPR
ncbi:hypothetical protein [Nocardiopsis sp. FR26]|uniref:hypothetical protein n=1 Tax=Nocardiopsis sp. FR26 TaxID=2605987 RepID=UPI0013590660|nr:hypothetical protein [Nocardiopsis sp. FR26]